MRKEDALQRQLKKPQSPETLKEKILANWDEQLSSEELSGLNSNLSNGSQKDRIFDKKEVSHIFKSSSVRFLATAASFVFIFMTWFMFDATPTVVYAALNDVANEEKHDGYSVSIENIVADFKIKLPPHFQSVGLVLGATKYCTLNQEKMVHLQLVNAKASGLEEGSLHSSGDKVHVFLSKNEISPALWQSYDGFSSLQDNKAVSWKIIQPRQGLYVLILFGKETQSEAIIGVTNEMFYI